MKVLRTGKQWFPGLVILLTIGFIGFQGTFAKLHADSGQGTELLQPGQPGQPGAYRGLEVTLLSLKKTNDYINAPDKDQKYVVLRFKVKNMGKKERSARITSDLQWKDPVSGRRDGYARTTGVKLRNPKSYDLTPGAQGEFEEVYMVPKTLSKVEFHLLKGYSPKEVARWLMPIK